MTPLAVKWGKFKYNQTDHRINKYTKWARAVHLHAIQARVEKTPFHIDVKDDP